MNNRLHSATWFLSLSVLGILGGWLFHEAVSLESSQMTASLLGGTAGIAGGLCLGGSLLWAFGSPVKSDLIRLRRAISPTGVALAFLLGCFGIW